jgi:energy-coupling factor transporter transmembrane protein EcfT
MKRIIPVIVIIVVLLAIGFFVSWWLAFSFGLTFLGTLGYLERIVKISLSRKWSVSLLIIFLLFSGTYNVTNFIKAKHSEAQIDDLNKKDGSAKKQIADLAGKVAESQQQIKARDAQIVELGRQAKVIRTIDGVIECVFSGNWRKHPGSLVPISWNKQQVYARIFEKNETENGAILFLLDSMRMARLDDGNLQVTLTVRAKVGTGPLGQEGVKLRGRWF